MKRVVGENMVTENRNGFLVDSLGSGKHCGRVSGNLLLINDKFVNARDFKSKTHRFLNK